MKKYAYLPKALLFAALGALLTSSLAAEPANSKRLRELDFSNFQAELTQFRSKNLARVEKLVANQSIAQLQGHMQAGKLTSELLTLYYLSRIQNFDEHLRSYTELNPKVLEEAKAADILRIFGRVRGPMHGIPVNLKDNIETQSPMHTTGGAEILLNSSPANDAPLVTQLRQQGAVILGKASLSEFAGVVTAKNPGTNAVSGAGKNPHLSKLPVLGSSSGSGISTAASLTVVSVGTETSGSLLAPATINGVVGMKPSRGLVSGKGVIPLIHFQDSAGPVARSVTDAAILLDAIDTAKVDYAKKLDAKALKGIRVGLLTELYSKEINQPGGVLPRIQNGLNQCGAVQVDIKEKLTQPDLTESLILGLAVDVVGYLEKTVGQVHSLSDLQSYNAADPTRRIPLGQDFIDLATQAVPEILQAHKTPPAEAGKLYRQLSLQNRKQAETTLNEAFAKSKVRVLVSCFNMHSQLYATAGYPAITVPLGLVDDGMPMGVTFIAQPGHDAELLAYAYAFEQATKLRATPAHISDP